MGSKLCLFTGGMIIGMIALVSCEPLYDRIKDMKGMMMNKMSKVKRNAEDSLAEMKVNLNTDDALDSIQDKIDDLINIVDSIDISKLKGKSKMALEAMKQKVMTLKQD